MLQAYILSLRTPRFYQRCSEVNEVKNWLNKGFHIESTGAIYSTEQLKERAGEKLISLGIYTPGDDGRKFLDQNSRTTW